MGSLEAMSAYLELLDSDANSLRKATLMVAMAWKDLDEDLESIGNSFDEGQILKQEGQILAEYETKVNFLQSQEKSLAERNSQLDSVRESLELRLKELEHKEENLRALRMEQVEEIKTREEKLEVTRTWVVQRVKEFGLREEKLNEQKRSIEELWGRIEREKEAFLGVDKSACEKLNVIGLKEKRCDDRFKEVDLIQDFVLARTKELELKEKQVELKEKQVEAMHITKEQSCKEFEMNLRARSDILDSVSASLERQDKELGEREKKVEQRERQIKAVPFNERLLKVLELKVQDQYRVLDSLRDLTHELAKKLDSEKGQVEIKRFLGLREKLYDYIRGLVQEGRQLIALRYVCVFDLGDDFPPADLLKEYISHLKMSLEKIRTGGHSSQKVKITAINKELKSIKEMMSCIRLYKLESEYPLESLITHVEQLEREKKDLESCIESPPTKTQPKERSFLQRKGVHAKRHKGFVPEHADNLQTQALCAQSLHQTDVPQLPYDHKPLFPIQVPCHPMPPQCSFSSTFGSPKREQVHECYSPSEHDLGTDIGIGWFSAWP